MLARCPGCGDDAAQPCRPGARRRGAEAAEAAGPGAAAAAPLTPPGAAGVAPAAVTASVNKRPAAALALLKG